jgi:hypothetical protein
MFGSVKKPWQQNHAGTQYQRSSGACRRLYNSGRDRCLRKTIRRNGPQ